MESWQALQIQQSGPENKNNEEVTSQPAQGSWTGVSASDM